MKPYHVHSGLTEGLPVLNLRDQRKLLPFRTGWIVSLAFFTDAALNGTLRKFGGAVFYGAERADCLCYAENGWEFGKWVAPTGLS